MRRVFQAARRDAGTSIALALFVAGTLFVVVYPFTRVGHPPMTDLPFHAAQAAIFRHYWDPAFHFREQFTLHPLEVPYIAMYGIGALAAFAFSIVTATKIMAVAMLLCLPLGLAVFFWGMGKNPLLGVVGLGLVWTDLTHWGFLSFVGALGLYAACIGCALALVREPTRWRQLALALALFGVFFTHVYRFPYALLGVALAAAVVYPCTRRARPLLLPLGVPALWFVLWLAIRPRQLSPGFPALGWNSPRFSRIPEFLFSSYAGAPGKSEQHIAWLMLAALIAVAVLGFAFRDAPDDGAKFRKLATRVPLLLAAGHLFAYLILPARMGQWWYVYPREIVAAVYIALGALPDLPTRAWIRVASVGLVVVAAGRMAALVASEWRAFEPFDRNFDAITRRLPPAPKLAYLIVDNTGTSKKNSPFVHLPAWVQAEKGGWLSFHFAAWGIFPVRYRTDSSASAAVPPAEPPDFEWHPEWFDVTRQGRFFDWFLVRIEVDPGPVVFQRDPSVRRVAREGEWWLYRRSPDVGN